MKLVKLSHKKDEICENIMILKLMVGTKISRDIYTHSLTSWCRILFEKPIVVTQLIKKYPTFFMEPEGSSPFSQKPTTGPYPDPS
jgi:hypothetical protein